MGHCLSLTARQVPSALDCKGLEKALRLTHEEYSVSMFQACDTITDLKFDSLLMGVILQMLAPLPQLPLSSVWAVTEKTAFPLQSQGASQGHPGM